MSELSKSIYQSALILGMVALVGASILSTTNFITIDKIKQNEQDFLRQKLNKILPKNSYDNNITKDTLTIPADKLLGTKQPHKVYVARKNGQIIALFLSPIATDGYNGDIHLLVAIRPDLTIVGTRVVKHQETAGLGDAIEEEKSNWIYQFTNKSLKNNLKVQKDGGEFDQFTGATITPRAILKALKNTLIYATKHQELFK